MPLIEIEDVCKSYQLEEVRVDALRGVSLTIDRGEFVALVGASGSGKSTLMNTLGCLDRPTTGSYRLAGEDIVTMNRDQRARIRNEQIGFVFQSFNLLNRTSALENVELPLLYRSGLSRSRRSKTAAEVLERVGLGDRIGPSPRATQWWSTATCRGGPRAGQSAEHLDGGRADGKSRFTYQRRNDWFVLRIERARSNHRDSGHA